MILEALQLQGDIGRCLLALSLVPAWRVTEEPRAPCSYQSDLGEAGCVLGYEFGESI